MDSPKTLKFTVEDINYNTPMKGAFALEDVQNLFVKSIDVPLESLQKKLSEMITNILLLLSSCNFESKEAEVSEVSFTIGIDSSGELSLFSVLKGGVVGRTGISLKIVRKKS